MSKSLMELIAEKKQQIDASKRPNSKKLPDGRSRIRILPSWRGADQAFWHDYGQHFIKDATGATKAVYICADRTFGRPCEVCAAIASAANTTGDDALTKTLTDAKAGPRVLVNALHIDGPTPTTPEVFELPPTVFADFIGIANLFGADGIDVLSLTEGFDISVERSGKGLGTKYQVTTVPKSTIINPDVMNKAQDLDKYVAQENEQNRARAILEVRNVAGLLTGGTTASLPASTASLLDVEEDLTQSIPSAAAPAAIGNARVVEAVDAEIIEQKPAQVDVAKTAATVAVAQAQATSSAAATSTGDDELDALLNDLKG